MTEIFCKQLGIISVNDVGMGLTQEYLQKRKGFGRGAGVVVACSGGVDSLTLADIFFHLRKRHDFFFCLAHFEHGIRGESSKDDAEFVKMWAAERNIPFYTTSADVPQYAKIHRLSLETAARNLRYGFLRRIAAEVGCAYIATAHHADDQAETVLMHFLRGTGVSGLKGMTAVNGDIIRPLLGVSKAELIHYAEVHGLTPRIDETNLIAADALRNKLRLQLLPLLKKEYNPNIIKTLGRLASVAADENTFLCSAADQSWGYVTETSDGQRRLLRKRFARLPVAVAREILRRFLAEAATLDDFEFVHIEAVRQLILTGHTGNFLNLPHNLTVKIIRNSMIVHRNEEVKNV